MTSRIALGTVQFGMPYGIANRTGQISGDAVGDILAIARGGGVDTLDTAIGYGESERVLGAAGVTDFKVITKLPPLPGDIGNVTEWVDGQVEKALVRLRLPSLHALLLHRPGDLLGPSGQQLRQALLGLKRDGRIRMLGFSIYAPSELNSIVPALAPDLVQSPFNVFDRRLKASGWLERLAGDGVEIHARSIFLQGLLLMEASDVPPKFAPWSAKLTRWRDWAGEHGVTRLHAALSFGLQHPEIARLVVGIDSAEHMREIVAASAQHYRSVPEDFGIDDDNLINPARWPSLPVEPLSTEPR